MIKRDIENKLINLAEKFPVVAVVGPRQSGKTTLVKNVFKNASYSNLEEPDTLLYSNKDPRAFLQTGSETHIIDEVQKSPALFSYIQSMVDIKKTPGQFILSGSQNFLLHEKISQTLAGRVAILVLLPFSLNELSSLSQANDYNYFLYNGFYPPVYDKDIPPTDWYPNYIQTYIERDVRQIKNIPDLNSFTLFVKLLAGRTGQLLNLSSISNELGVSVNTLKNWLSVLESSFITYRLFPQHKNFNKRITKTPKLYFYDMGLVTSLLGIKDVSQLKNYYNLGSLFENLIISEIMKSRTNRGIKNNLYFWRDKTGREIDCIIDEGINRILIEIKSGMTITEEYFKNISFYKDIAGETNIPSFIIYGGKEKQKRNIATILPWNNFKNDIE